MNPSIEVVIPRMDPFMVTFLSWAFFISVVLAVVTLALAAKFINTEGSMALMTSGIVLGVIAILCGFMWLMSSANTMTDDQAYSAIVKTANEMKGQNFKTLECPVDHKTIETSDHSYRAESRICDLTFKDGSKVKAEVVSHYSGSEFITTITQRAIETDLDS